MDPRRPIALLAAAALSALLVGCGPSPSGVDGLVATHRTHASAFREIVKSAAGENRLIIDLDSYDVRPRGLSQQRIASLTAALDDIGARRVECDSGEINVSLGSSGMVSSGSEWGYVYTTGSPPAPVVSLEAARLDSALERWYYPLGGGWYATACRW